MTGPDSDGWPANPSGEKSWDWQSTDTCSEAERLLDGGGDDEELLLVVGRYTVENLILNAVHEIGEWLRLDGHRLFPAHLAHPSGPGAGDGQGNGAVTIEVGFAPMKRPVAPPSDQRPDELGALRRLRVIQQTLDCERFTYLPGTSIQFRGYGPVVLHHQGGSSIEWRGDWSPATTEAAHSKCDPEILVAGVGMDVHRALVACEADRICRAFHIDGRRPWTLACGDPTPQADETVTVHVSYQRVDG